MIRRYESGNEERDDRDDRRWLDSKDWRSGIRRGGIQVTTDGTRFEQGLVIRRAVLGADHVDRSLANVSDFSRTIQELVTEYVWGTVWSRPGLDRRERSIVNLAMLTALNRQHELAVHVQGALRNGCTEEEIREVLLQTAVYCGVPAGLDAFRTAESAIRNYRTADAQPKGAQAP